MLYHNPVKGTLIKRGMKWFTIDVHTELQDVHIVLYYFIGFNKLCYIWN